MKDFSLNSVKKTYIFDQDKIINPEKTVKQVIEKLKNVFPDKKFELNNISENGFEVYDFLDDDDIQRGKGATKNQSKASAVMEFVERFSWKNFDYRNNLNYKKLHYNELKNKDKINFDIFVNKFLRGRKKEQEFLPYLKNIKYDFIESISLIDKELKSYPLNFNNISQTSNGMCSGNCKEEAILQGLCEIVERHNFAYFLHNLETIEFNLINIASIKDKITLDLINKIQNMDIELFFVNLTLDLKVPTFMVCGKDNNLDVSDFGFIGYGYGTSPSPEKAILRALTEYVQMRELNEKYDSKSEFLQKRNQINANFQFALKEEIFEKIEINKNFISIENVRDLSNQDFLKEIINILNLFKERDFDVVIVDKTLSKIDIPVFRVWSPNLMIGTTFDSNFDNLYLQTLNLIVQSGDKNLSQEFYEKYFNEILFDENDVNLNLIFESHPFLTRDILKKYLTPKTYPYQKFIPKDYIDYINLNK